jgi:hypothetical protein
MDRRQSLRLPANLPAQLTLLSEDAPPSPAPPCNVTVAEISGHGARIWSPLPLPIGAAVKLELEDDLYLGEVRHCCPTGQGFLAGLHLDCALASLSGIRALMLALLDPGASLPSGRSQTADPRQQGHHQQQRQGHQEQPPQPVIPPPVA